ncbi:MAG TPA: PorP/SprF family type IX secretion system membrane protein [Chitinophagales bacterium]|nr:PorP/SprF family type IX secretion system membrane protein [Chitinophagales bacterium]
MRPYNTYLGRWCRERFLRYGLALCLVSCISYLSAQDIHFTQFFTNPLILNPAQTGNYDGNYRLGFNFKAQWPFAITGKVYNHHTESPFVDFSFGERKLKTAWFGLGMNFVNDEAGDGRLTYRRIGLSGAYHQAFDKDHRYVLSTGFGFSYIIRSVDFSKFYFNNQWVDDFGFNITLPNGEPLQRESFQMIDLNAGLNFAAQIHEQVKLEVGFSMLHLNRPKHSFLGTTERLGFRYQASAGVTYNVNEKISILVNAYYGNEKKAQEITAGAMLGYGISKRRSADPENTIYIGLYYRALDALAPVVGYKYKSTRILFNYDVTLSGLAKPGRANGGPELSIVHTGSFYKHFGTKKVYCPSFR